MINNYSSFFVKILKKRANAKDKSNKGLLDKTIHKQPYIHTTIWKSKIEQQHCTELIRR